MISVGPLGHLYATLYLWDHCSWAGHPHPLATKGIGTQVHYLPVNRQPYYRQRYGDTNLIGADAYYDRILTLPLEVGMTLDDVDYVLQCLTEVLGAGG